MSSVDPNPLADRQQSIPEHKLARYSPEALDRMGDVAQVDEDIHALID